MKKKCFDVFGQEIKINYSKVPVVNENNQILAGFYSIPDHQIFISPANEKETTLTLYHELFHAIIYRTGAAQIISFDAQEILCEGFANFIYENFELRKTKRK